jgi:Ca2+-binding EF-hand superfamily protein
LGYYPGFFSIFQADIDNSGTIDYGEFLAATLHMNKLEREESLVSAFSFFDKDGSGFITIDELSQACNQFGLSDVHLEDMIKDVDQNNVGFFNPFLFLIPLYVIRTELDDVNLYVTFRMVKLIIASSLQ